MRKEKKASLVVLVTVAALAGATAGPAGAVVSGQAEAAVAAYCPEGSVCLFEEPGFGGASLPLVSLDSGGVCVDLAEHGWADRARSALNTLDGSAALFMNEDCLGGPFQVAGNSGTADFGTFRPASVWVPAQ